MPRKDDFKDFVLAQLGSLDGLTCKAMFGGHGLYRGSAFFGIIFKGRLYLHTTDATRDKYEAQGMQAFRPNAKQKLHAYYEVPRNVLEDATELLAWVKEAARR